MTYPSGATVAFGRDATGRINGILAQPTAGSAPVTLVSAVEYAPFGPLSKLTFGNGRQLDRAHDLNYGIDAVTDSAPDGVAIDVGLDDIGNVTALDERLKTGAVANRVVEYDGLDRLSALKDGSTTVQGFSYDATGNRLQKVDGSTESYLYEPTSHRLTQTGAVARTYSAAGHGTGIGMKTFTYDDHGRRVQYLNAGVLAREYRYNGRGERVAKLNTPAPEYDRYYVYDEAGHLLGEYRPNGSRVAEYVWMDDTLVAVMSTHDGSYQQYVLTDHLNTPRAVVRPDTNTIVWRWDLTPTAFGDHAADSDPDGDGVAFTFNLRYPGQFYDSETGLHYNYFRDYDPSTGRYVQSDPIGLAAGLTTYGYVGGSPLSGIDPLGLRKYELSFVLGRGSVSGRIKTRFGDKEVSAGGLNITVSGRSDCFEYTPDHPQRDVFALVGNGEGEIKGEAWWDPRTWVPFGAASGNFNLFLESPTFDLKDFTGPVRIVGNGNGTGSIEIAGETRSFTGRSSLPAFEFNGNLYESTFEPTRENCGCTD